MTNWRKRNWLFIKALAWLHLIDLIEQYGLQLGLRDQWQNEGGEFRLLFCKDKIRISWVNCYVLLNWDATKWRIFFPAEKCYSDNMKVKIWR